MQFSRDTVQIGKHFTHFMIIVGTTVINAFAGIAIQIPSFVNMTAQALDVVHAADSNQWGFLVLLCIIIYKLFKLIDFRSLNTNAREFLITVHAMLPQFTVVNTIALTVVFGLVAKQFFGCAPSVWSLILSMGVLHLISVCDLRESAVLSERIVKKVEPVTNLKENVIVREMATGQSVNKIALSPNGFLICTRNEDDTFVGVGNGFTVVRNGETLLVTAKHVADVPSAIYCLRKNAVFKLPDPKWIPFGEDGVYCIPPSNFTSMMGLRNLKMVPFNLKSTVSINSLWEDGKSSKTSMGYRNKTELPKRMHYVTYSSEPGDSGSPVMQGDRVVGVHSGSNHSLKLNIFQSLYALIEEDRLYSTELALADIVARHKVIIPVTESYEPGSGADGDKYEDQPDWDDYKDLRGGLSNSRYMSAFTDAEDFVEFYNELRDRDDFSLFHELDNEMRELEDQGFGVRSKEAVAVRSKIFGKLHRRERGNISIRVDNLLNFSRAPSPQNRMESLASTIPQGLKSSTVKSILKVASSKSVSVKEGKEANPRKLEKSKIQKESKSSTSTTGPQPTKTPTSQFLSSVVTDQRN